MPLPRKSEACLPLPFAGRGRYGWKNQCNENYSYMKKIFCLLSLLCSLSLSAQSVEGTSYYLPKVGTVFTVKVEKTTYTPGQFAPYARLYLKKDVAQEAQTSYRLLGIEMTPVAAVDTSKHFTLTLGKKVNITKVAQADNGQLLAINAEAQEAKPTLPTFIPAPKATPLNPKDFMTEDILNAGSMPKMAELTAQEIYDLRDSRNQITRGQADFMPKDGQQMDIMMENLDRQEQALRQTFEGTVTKDTTWTTLSYLPVKEGEEVLFRFSRRLGLLEKDDLAGTPYYIKVEDLHTLAAPEPEPAEKKEDKNDIGLRVNQNDKIRLTVAAGDTALGNTGAGVGAPSATLATCELLAPQFGTVESLSGELFGKKQTTSLVIDALTGSVKKIETIGAE